VPRTESGKHKSQSRLLAKDRSALRSPLPFHGKLSCGAVEPKFNELQQRITAVVELQAALDGQVELKKKHGPR
jgi:hypothetical protein